MLKLGDEDDRAPWSAVACDF